MKKLPKIDKFEFNNKVNNNKRIFDSMKETDIIKRCEKKVEQDKKYDKMTVHDKLKELINQSSYIFNTPVILVFASYEEACQIAGVVNNHIITMDNKIIKISDIKNIKILKK